MLLRKFVELWRVYFGQKEVPCEEGNSLVKAASNMISAINNFHNADQTHIDDAIQKVQEAEAIMSQAYFDSDRARNDKQYIDKLFDADRNNTCTQWYRHVSVRDVQERVRLHELHETATALIQM